MLRMLPVQGGVLFSSGLSFVRHIRKLISEAVVLCVQLLF